MEFNENQAEILSQAVALGYVKLPLTDYIAEDVSYLVRKGVLIWSWSGTHVLKPTAYGITIVRLWEREVSEYQRGYDDGFRAGASTGFQI